MKKLIIILMSVVQSSAIADNFQSISKKAIEKSLKDRYITATAIFQEYLQRNNKFIEERNRYARDLKKILDNEGGPHVYNQCIEQSSELRTLAFRMSQLSKEQKEDAEFVNKIDKYDTEFRKVWKQMEAEGHFPYKHIKEVSETLERFILSKVSHSFSNTVYNLYLSTKKAHTKVQVCIIETSNLIMDI